jgi:endoglucanase
MLITHHQATWWEGGFWAGPVTYPGKPIAGADEAYINQRFIDQRVPQWSNEVWNRDRIAEDFALPLSVAKRAGVPLYCGEWGAIRHAPREPRLAWYRDMLSLFDEHGIAWANWDYSAGFAPLIENGEPTEIASLLY